jgi:hypothetical protein
MSTAATTDQADREVSICPSWCRSALEYPDHRAQDEHHAGVGSLWPSHWARLAGSRLQVAVHDGYGTPRVVLSNENSEYAALDPATARNYAAMLIAAADLLDPTPA